MATLDQSTEGVYIICRQPRGRSKKGDCAEIDGIERIGMISKTDKAPKDPSKPTATRGATV